MIKTQCPECKTPLSEEEADIAEGVLRCPQCGREQPLLETVMGLDDKAHKVVPQHVKGADIRTGKTLDLKLSPSLTGYSYYILTFGIILLVATGSLANYLRAEQDLSSPETKLILIVISAVLFFVGIAATLTGIKRIIQYTHIKVDKDQIRIRYSWFDLLPVGGKRLAVNQVRQFFVTQFEEGKGSGNFVYAVKAMLVGRRIITLVNRLGKAEYAFLIERKLEDYLNIEDQIVAGEYIPSHTIPKYQKEQESTPIHNRMIIRGNYSPMMENIVQKLHAKEKRKRQEQDLSKPVLKGGQLQPAIYIACAACGESLSNALANVSENLIQCQACKKIEALGGLQFSTQNAEAWLKKVKSPAGAKRVSIQEGLGLKLIIKPAFFSRNNTFWWIILAIITLLSLGGGLLLELVKEEEYKNWLYFWGGLVILLVLVAFVGSLTRKIVIEVDAGRLLNYNSSFGNGYILRKKEFQRHNIDQLFVKRTQINDSSYYDYSLMVKLKNGKERRIIRYLSNLKEGYFLEHKIESFWGIEDRPVPNEYTPPTFSEPELTKTVKMNREYFQ